MPARLATLPPTVGYRSPTATLEVSAMYGSLPAYHLAPPAFRLALDAAAALLGPRAAPLLRCDADGLAGELASRFVGAPVRPAGAAVWAEPQRAGWPGALAELLGELRPGAPLLVVLSQPAARLIAPRAAGGRALGLAWGGSARLLAALHAAGASLEARYGFQTPAALGLARLAALAELAGRPGLADRLGAAARLLPPAVGRAGGLAAVGLIVARTPERL